MDFHISKKVPYGFSEALEKIRNALGQAGFGVITEIDLGAKFKEKLDVDFREYRILGNPKLAHKAIKQEDKIGVLLPCNILVQELENNQVAVTAVNPMETMASVANPGLEPLAKK